MLHQRIEITVARGGFKRVENIGVAITQILLNKAARLQMQGIQITQRQ